MKMATSTAGFLCVIFVSCVVVPGLATVYTVGDSAGWAMGVDYSTWASGKTFVPGDSLVFNYGSSHTVDEVTSSDYSACRTGNALNSDSSGATTVQLTAPGTRNFICGIPSHCGGGMKLAVTTVKAASAKAAPPSDTTAAPPATITTPAPESSVTDTPLGSPFDTPSGSTTTDTPASTTTTTTTTSPAAAPKTTAVTHTVPSSSVAISPVTGVMITLAVVMCKFMI